MKNISKLLFSLWFFLISVCPANAALTASTIFEIESGATANFVNGAGFNPANANFISNATATSANTNAPVISSASYSFVSGDAGSWWYTKSGTNWTPGWCKIASVATGSATLNAAIGACITGIDAQGNITYNTVAGVATTASPTAGTGGVDYSQQSTAALTGTDGTQTAAGTTFTVTSETFTTAMVGNLLHITACTGTGCLPGWYEIVSYTDSHDVVLDRTATNGSAAITAATFYVGGAGNFGALEDSFQSILPASAIVWVKNGSYTLSASTSTTNANCTSQNTCYWVGYNALRGDMPTGSNQPAISTGSNTIANGGTQRFSGFNISGSTTTTLLSTSAISSKIFNKVASTAHAAYGGTLAINDEIVSLNGPALSSSSAIVVIGSYLHDSTTCLSQGGASGTIAIGNIIEGCTTAGISLFNGNNNVFQNNTIYGNENKLGTGISATTSATTFMANNIFYGLSTGISFTTLETGNYGLTNDFYNNTTNSTNWLQNQNSLGINPQFSSTTTLTNTGTVTGNTTTLTDTGASFGVTNNVDILHVTSLSGTGCTTGGYLITAHTSTTLTLNNSLGGSACTSIVYWINHGHNFQIGTNLKALGFPSFTAATESQTTSYPDVGAVQRQEPSGSGGTVGYAAP